MGEQADVERVTLVSFEYPLEAVSHESMEAHVCNGWCYFPVAPSVGRVGVEKEDGRISPRLHAKLF